MNIPDNFQVIDHALIHHKLGLIRDKNTGSKEFRELVVEITMLLAYDATKYLSLKDVEVQTPITTVQVKTVEVADVVLVPILRAGLGMVEGMLKLIPNARVGYVGMERDHETHQPVDYYFKIPKQAQKMTFIVLDPMLATGGTIIATVDRLKDLGADRILCLCIISAPEGMEAFCEHHQDVKVYTGALDDHLNSNKYIVPGLGDAGDRLFGTD
jgi:uracil phosphoribosyltransferase